MNKREIKQWRKALKATRERWQAAQFVDSFLRPLNGYPDDDCPLCTLSKKIYNQVGDKYPRYHCLHCLYTHAVGTDDCSFIIVAAEYQRRRRPIMRVIDRMERYLDKEEGEK